MPNSNNSAALKLPLMEPTANTNIPYIDKQTCAEVTGNSSSNFMAAFKFLPKEKRIALVKVYAFFRIADDCVDELESNDDKTIALNYWEQELLKVYNNQEAHAIMMDLKPVLDRFKIPQEYLTGLIEGCRMDITQNRYQTFSNLYDYCYKVASLVGLTCLKIFEYESDTAKQWAIDLGMAFQLTNIIRDISSDLELDRIYLAQEDILASGYSQKELLAKTDNQEFKKLVKFYTDKSLDYYNKAQAEFEKDTDNKLIAAKVMCLVYRSILDKIIKQDYPVLNKRVSLSFFQKIKILFPVYFKYQLKN